METFAERLKIVKKENGLNGTQLAELMGVTRQSLNKYFKVENPAKPRQSHVDKLCNYFGYNSKWLLFGIGPKKAQAPASYIHKPEPTPTVKEPEEPTMSIVNVLEAYYKEIDIIKNLLTLKQEIYGKVIFSKGQ